MGEFRFEVVFRKLGEELAADGGASPEAPCAPSHRELEEIEELRRIVLEVLEEPVTSYTTT